MRIPGDAIIPPAKLAGYLLVKRLEDDKSAWLAQAGFGMHNIPVLEEAILDIVAAADAIRENENMFGVYYTVRGHLHGPNGIRLPAVTVWIRRHEGNAFSLVTVKPWRRRRCE